MLSAAQSNQGNDSSPALSHAAWPGIAALIPLESLITAQKFKLEHFTFDKPG